MNIVLIDDNSLKVNLCPFETEKLGKKAPRMSIIIKYPIFRGLLGNKQNV